MRTRILLKAPILSQSGYGHHARTVLRALKTRQDLFDIYVIPINWGQTGWISTRDEEREWIDKKIAEAHIYTQNGGQFDMSLQVTIPNEWERIAPYNVGYTAGIETTRVAPEWIEKTNMMDKVVVVSNHAKNIFEETFFVPYKL